ncbi:MAG: IS607 family transposase [Candidatus Lokiarchaeota archaeon]|nr:IS607 family transposase [Candidatus Lokiarchaeota archaeon]
MPSLAISIGHAANILGVCTKTLRRWDSSGSFTPLFRTAGGHRRYDKFSVLEYAKKQKKGRKNGHQNAFINAAIYGRVSSSKQKNRGDLKRQIENIEQHCKKRGYHIADVFQDVGSGLNDKRRGLKKMLKMIARGKCDVVVVNYQDRLARFGIGVIQEFLASWGVRLEIINSTITDSSPHAELITDLTAILYSFMGRLYRSRKGKKTNNGKKRSYIQKEV